MSDTITPAAAGTRPSASSMRIAGPQRPLRLALPKGRQQEAVERLFRDAGIGVRTGARAYRPELSLDRTETKLLKPQNVVGMLAAGARDVGFCGADWVQELDADLVLLLDVELDPVRLVAAAPPEVAAMLRRGNPERRLVVASEYVRLTSTWIRRRALEADVLRTFGATEVFPPEDADLIVDNMSSGATLRANGLEIVDEVLRSSTGLYASPAALRDPELAPLVHDLVLTLRAVLDARKRVMLELNVGPAEVDAVMDALPCMRQPTLSALRADTGFAVRAAVPRVDLPRLIPALKALGATDIVVSEVSLLVP
jgi:ATP phosphoribosyltransferase